MARKDPNSALRNALLQERPEWRGKIRINRYSVTVTGVGSAEFYAFSPRDDEAVYHARDYIELIEDELRVDNAHR